MPNHLLAVQRQWYADVWRTGATRWHALAQFPERECSIGEGTMKRQIVAAATADLIEPISGTVVVTALF